jgi:hypothetical protein
MATAASSGAQWDGIGMFFEITPTYIYIAPAHLCSWNKDIKTFVIKLGCKENA